MSVNYTVLLQALVSKLGGQIALAKKLGVSQATVSNWLGGSDISGANRDAIDDLSRSNGIEPSSDLQMDPKIVELLSVKRKPGFARPDKAMGDAILTKEQSRAGRGLLGWNQNELSARSGVGIATLRGFETGIRTLTEANLKEMRKAMERDGVEFIDRGVRLR